MIRNYGLVIDHINRSFAEKDISVDYASTGDTTLAEIDHKTNTKEEDAYHKDDETVASKVAYANQQLNICFKEIRRLVPIKKNGYYHSYCLSFLVVTNR